MMTVPAASFSLVCFLLGAPPDVSPADEPPVAPSLLLAETYEGDVDLGSYWVSEKLDGVRAYWDGRRLITRGGHVIHTPPGFTRGFPEVPLDGELWIQRRGFDEVSGLARREEPDERAWRNVRYMVFDLPASALDFDGRLAQLRSLRIGWRSPHLQFVRHIRIDNHAALMRHMEAAVSQGAEGLMLHRGDSFYVGARSRDLLKLKRHRDAEARVVAHTPGKGKHEGVLGALVVETPEGVRFRIGSGFSDAERRSPPPVGSLVTYRYTGKSKAGVPRFARFIRLADAL